MWDIVSIHSYLLMTSTLMTSTHVINDIIVINFQTHLGDVYPKLPRSHRGPSWLPRALHFHAVYSLSSGGRRMDRGEKETVHWCWWGGDPVSQMCEIACLIVTSSPALTLLFLPLSPFSFSLPFPSFFPLLSPLLFSSSSTLSLFSSPPLSFSSCSIWHNWAVCSRIQGPGGGMGDPHASRLREDIWTDWRGKTPRPHGNEPGYLTCISILCLPAPSLDLLFL